MSKKTQKINGDQFYFNFAFVAESNLKQTNDCPLLVSTLELKASQGTFIIKQIMALMSYEEILNGAFSEKS